MVDTSQSLCYSYESTQTASNGSQLSFARSFLVSFFHVISVFIMFPFPNTSNLQRLAYCWSACNQAFHLDCDSLYRVSVFRVPENWELSRGLSADSSLFALKPPVFEMWFSRTSNCLHLNSLSFSSFLPGECLDCTEKWYVTAFSTSYSLILHNWLVSLLQIRFPGILGHHETPIKAWAFCMLF